MSIKLVYNWPTNVRQSIVQVQGLRAIELASIVNQEMNRRLGRYSTDRSILICLVNARQVYENDLIEMSIKFIIVQRIVRNL